MTMQGHCLSDLALDRYLAGELPGSQRAAIEAHCAGCDDCARLLQQRRDEAEALLSEIDLGRQAESVLARQRAARPRQVPERSSGSRRWLPWLGGLATAAAAAAVALMVWPTREAIHLDGEPVIRTKGGFAIGAFLSREGDVGRARSGQDFYPGDRLRFTYTVDRPGYLHLVGVDAEEAVTVYLPGEEPGAHVRPATDRPLSGAVELDETLGLEVIIGLHCPRPLSSHELDQRARPLAEGAAFKSGHIRWLSPRAWTQDQGCRVARFDLHKRLPGD